MSQFAAAKNPPWMRTGATSLVQPPPPASSILTAQQVSHATAAANAAGLAAAPAIAAGGANPLAAAAAVVAAAAQSQQAQQAPAVSAGYGTGLAAITLTQSALQQGAMLQQQGIAIPASLAATTQVANVNNGMVVEIARLPQPGVALPTSLATTQVATVSYPAPRLLAQTTQYQAPQPHPQSTAIQQAAAAAAAVVQQHSAQQQHQATQQQQQRVFTGTVTKLHENFGFIDDDVFFQISVVKGNIPKVGDTVLVEASYNPNMPFKWSATRVQVLQNQVVQLNVQQANNNRPPINQQRLAAIVAANVAQSVNMNTISNMANNQIAFSNVAQQGRWQVQQEMAVVESLGGQQQRLNIQLNNQQPWIQDVDYSDILDNKGPRMSNMARRHSPPSRRDRERERDIRRDDRRDRYRERERYSPPARKRSRSPRRPSRSPPRRRTRTVPRYTVQIPKISLDLNTGNVMELRKRYSNLYIPSDFCAAKFLWQNAFPSNRPFTMDRQCNFHIVGKDMEAVFENDAVLEPSDADWSYSVKVMLMSTPGLSEIFHKSCALAEDGDDVKENFVHPTRLISFLVGLKGKNETVAIGGPWSPSLDGPNPDSDPSTLVKTAIRTCKALTGIDLSKCSQWYRFAEIYYRRGESSSHKGRGMRVETVVLFVPDVWSCLPTRVEWDGMIAAGSCKKQLLQQKHPEEMMETEAQDEEEGSSEGEKKEPTHYSELDPKTIKVNDLKRELEARNLSAKGLKSQLVARLTNALKNECEKESGDKQVDLDADKKAEDADESVDDEKKKDKEDDKKSSNEKDKIAEKLNFPDMPSIIVQPSKTAKNGKFDCTVMSLSLLLDYRQEDNKEHSFEVSLFAELFNEMMMRDFGFRIYRALVEAPETKDDEKEKKKYDKKDDNKKDRKDDKDDSRRKDDANDFDSDRDDDESDDDDYDGEDKRDKDRKKKRRKRAHMVTCDPYLLLSFVYFDQTHCGYLLEKDIEEILQTLGLMLSRAQVRKLIQKVCKREMFRYRKLTDKPVDADKIPKLDLKTNLEELAAGNKKYIPTFKNNASEEIIRTGDSECRSIISFNGALLDVAKLMEQLERSEKARLDADEKLKSLQQELGNLNEVNASKEKQSLKLTLNLEEQSKKLKNTEEDLKKTKIEAEKYYKALSNIRDGLQSNLNIAEYTLQKGKSKSTRSSPMSCADSDSENSSQSNKNRMDTKTEKESNGFSNANCESSDSVQIKTDKDEKV